MYIVVYRSPPLHWLASHYCDVIMATIASQITSLMIVYSTVYSDADQRKHQSSASLAFVRGIHRGPVNSPPKGPVTRKMFPFDDVIMFYVYLTKISDASRENQHRNLYIWPTFTWAAEWTGNWTPNISSKYVYFRSINSPDCFFKSLLRLRTTKISNFRISGPLWGEPRVANLFPSQMESNAENVSTSWSIHGFTTVYLPKHDQSLNSSPPSAAYMRQWIGSTLVQIMACRLFAPGHYLNQCWLIVNWTTRNIFQWSWNRNSILFIQENAIENVVCPNGGHFV